MRNILRQCSAENSDYRELVITGSEAGKKQKRRPLPQATNNETSG